MASFWTVGVTFCQNTAEQSFTKGVEYAAEGEFERAKEKFVKTLKLDPTHEFAKEFLMLIEDIDEQEIQTKAAVPFFKGAIYALRGQWTEAIVAYNRAIEIEPNHAMPYMSRGKAYAQKGEYNQAVSDFTKAIEINPKEAEAYYNRGIAYHLGGLNDLAISDFTKAIEINPRDAEAHNNRGTAYASKGHYDKAITDYNKAIETNPRLAMAYIDRGLVYMERLRKKDKACSDWERACELGECYHYTIAKRMGNCE